MHAGPTLRAESFRCAIQDRVFSLVLPRNRRFVLCLLVSSGRTELSGPDVADGRALEGPSLFWTPWSEEGRLRLRAGSTGTYLAIGDEVLAMAIGHNAESADLRLLSERQALVQLRGAEALTAAFEQACTIMSAEADAPQRGSASLIESQIRTLLVLLWRHGQREGPGTAPQPQAARILQHFRQLLELHFRERWAVGRYAGALAISTDRLHDICRRTLGKSPRQLVHERLLHEARLMLERSTLTVEQIAAALSFQDSPHFTRFFRAGTGMPPGRYRRAVLGAPAERDRVTRPDYADWP